MILQNRIGGDIGVGLDLGPTPDDHLVFQGHAPSDDDVLLDVALLPDRGRIADHDISPDPAAPVEHRTGSDRRSVPDPKGR